VHFKRKLAIGVATLAAAAFAGGAYAAAQDSTGNQRKAFLSDVAKRLNVSPQQLTAALEAALQDQLNAAVKAGKLTQAQANALAQRAQRGALGAGPAWFGLPGLGLPGVGAWPHLAPPTGSPTTPGSPPNPSTPGSPAPGTARLAGPLGAAANYLGLSVTQLVDQLRSGKTLAQIASSRRKSVSGLQQAMIASVKARLDQAVADKRITSAQEQQLLGRLSSAIGAEINGTGPERFHGHPGRLPGWGYGPRPGLGRLPGAVQPGAPAPGPIA